MSNGTEHTDDDPRVDDLLNRLIRTAAQQTPSDFAWPQDETILAYFQGNANKEQHETIQAAIAKSSEFRRFMIDTAEQLSTVTSNAAVADFDSVQVPESIMDLHPAPVRPWPAWFNALRRPRVLAPIVIGALAVFILLVGPMDLFQHRTVMLAEYSELDRSEFVSLSQRGTHPEDSIPKAFATAYDAAMSRLRESVAYELTSGGYKLSEGAPTSAASTTGNKLVLRIVDKQGTEIGKITTPANGDTNISAEAWLVFPPQLTLWHLPLNRDSVDITLPIEHPERGCVTVTEQTDSGYVATPGHIFQL